jgi:aspartate kinase
MTFTTSKADARRAYKLMKKAAGELGAKLVAVDEDIAKVSIVGSGMRSHSGIAAKMFTLLANEGINIEMISTSEIKISCVIKEKYGELAVRSLHTGFGLDAEEVVEEQ